MKDYNRPEVLNGRTEKLRTLCGALYIVFNEDKNKLMEVRPMIGKVGSCPRVLLEGIGVLISLLLQNGVDREKIAKGLSNSMDAVCSMPIKYKGEEYHSCLDCISKKVVEELLNRGEINVEEEVKEEVKEENKE